MSAPVVMPKLLSLQAPAAQSAEGSVTVTAPSDVQVTASITGGDSLLTIKSVTAVIYVWRDANPNEGKQLPQIPGVQHQGRASLANPRSSGRGDKRREHGVERAGGSDRHCRRAARTTGEPGCRHRNGCFECQRHYMAGGKCPNHLDCRSGRHARTGHSRFDSRGCLARPDCLFRRHDR